MILGVFPMGIHTVDPPSTWRKARDLISSSGNLAVNVMIQDIPRYRPMSTLLNQFCYFLSTSTSISLRLNSSDLLLASLETFNKEHIFSFLVLSPKKILISGHQTQKPIFIPTIFVSLVFHPWEHTNPNILMGAKQWVRVLFLFSPFEPCVFYSHHIVQKIYLHSHHPDDHHHHHHHNNHHTTSTSTHL